MMPSAWSNLTPGQQNAVKDLAILAAIYFATKTASAVVKYGVMGGVGYLLYQNYKQVAAGGAGLSGGWQMKVDPSLAVEMMLPGLSDTEKTYAKLAAGHVLNGLLRPQGY